MSISKNKQKKLANPSVVRSRPKGSAVKDTSGTGSDKAFIDVEMNDDGTLFTSKTTLPRG